jgi:hypothetical protein
VCVGIYTYLCVRQCMCVCVCACVFVFSVRVIVTLCVCVRPSLFRRSSSTLTRYIIIHSVILLNHISLKESHPFLILLAHLSLSIQYQLLPLPPAHLSEGFALDTEMDLSFLDGEDDFDEDVSHSPLHAQVHVYIYIYVCVYVYMCVCVCIYIYVCACVCVYVCVS